MPMVWSRSEVPDDRKSRRIFVTKPPKNEYWRGGERIVSARTRLVKCFVRMNWVRISVQCWSLCIRFGLCQVLLSGTKLRVDPRTCKGKFCIRNIPPQTLTFLPCGLDKFLFWLVLLSWSSEEYWVQEELP